MAGDDIRDLLGRYAAGGLTTEERERLFDAALSDQELFEELAREQELKLLLDEPGARDRMIHSLAPPRRRMGWILGGGIAVALSVVLIAFLLRPPPKPEQVAMVTTAPAEAPAPEIAMSEPQPSGASKAAKPKGVGNRPAVSASSAKDAEKKEPDQVAVAVASPVAPAPQRVADMRAMAPRAKQPAAGVAGGNALVAQPAFGFHYSIPSKGNLRIVPDADGYLFVKSDDGSILFERKQIPAAITVDIAVPDAANSLSITFSSDSAPVETTPTARTESNGIVEGSRRLAIELKVK